MSKLLSPVSNFTNLKTPFDRNGIRRIIALLQEASSDQAAAADASASLMTKGIATHAGSVVWCYLVVGVAAETNETMTVNVLKNGVSILSAAYTIDADTPVDSIIELPLASENTHIDIGDKLTVTRDWTTGGGTDTLANTSVRVGWAPR